MTLEKFIDIVLPYTMTSIERITCLYESLEHIRENNIRGDVVECGVWKGGNIKGIIDYFDYHKMYDRNVYLYDTFTGMTEPEPQDIDFEGNLAISIIDRVRCECSLEDVKNLLSQSLFPNEKIKFIIGDVSETLNSEENVPKVISLLRLDTDWYKSTKKELDVLYPRLSKNGVMIVDDYGHWQGAKKAVDEYFTEIFEKIYTIDYTGIKVIKSLS